MRSRSLQPGCPGVNSGSPFLSHAHCKFITWDTPGPFRTGSTPNGPPPHPSSLHPGLTGRKATPRKPADPSKAQPVTPCLRDLGAIGATPRFMRPACTLARSATSRRLSQGPGQRQPPELPWPQDVRSLRGVEQ